MIYTKLFVIKFQYNICFGSTYLLSMIQIMKDYFNTTFVSVRHSNLTQYILFKKISIQHLFRFDTVQTCNSLKRTLFQYNICFGSTFFEISTISPKAIFQYNICFGSTKSCCSAFSDFIFISIQHLFRFDLQIVSTSLGTNGFQYNICFGSTERLENIKKKAERFQYNICFGSTQVFIKNNLVHQYFNTTFVSVRQCNFSYT